MKCKKNIKEGPTMAPTDLHIKVRIYEMGFTVIVEFACVKGH